MEATIPMEQPVLLAMLHLQEVMHPVQVVSQPMDILLQSSDAFTAQIF
jgi:hypothetical protein